MKPGVTLVTTAGRGALDRYGSMLAACLPVATLELDLGTTSAGAFGMDARGSAALHGFRRDVGLVRVLRRRPGVLHLASHHLGRYANVLRRPFIVTAHDTIRLADARDGAMHISRPTARDRLCIELDYRGITRAAAIIAPSAAAKQDLVRSLGVDPARVSVVHDGLDHRRFRPVTRRFVAEPYVLFVGSEHPRKNVAAVLRALAELKRGREFRHLRLVKVGAAGSGEAPFHAPVAALVRSLGLGRDVIFTGVVPDADLPAYYSGAACLAFPSFAEGFGFPVLEAMACGCPVVASTAGSLPEVAGDAAVLVPPADHRALRDALERFVCDPAERARYRDRGLQRAAAFSWERAARETLEVYGSVAGAA
jgi:glycosyltransferase involved in cell wall biosynthesis